MRTSPDQIDDRLTLAAIGVLVATLSSIAHEAIGHGGTCLAVGGTITRLTATHFACENGSLLVDAAGPAMNLVVALAAFALLRTCAADTAALRLFLFVLGAVNLCWLAGEVVVSPLVMRYDEAAIARQLGWPPLWRPAMVLVGLALYFGTIRYAAAILLGHVRTGDAPYINRARFGIVHLAAILSFVAAGLCWARAPLPAAQECFMTMAVAVAPLWLAFGPVVRASGGQPLAPAPIARSIDWIAAAILLFALFALFQGRGIGRLA